MSDAKLAAQLYTLRDAGLDFEGMLRAVKAAGFQGVETRSTPLPAAEMRAALERHGLEACSSHVPLATLESDFEATVGFHGEAGIGTLVVPFLPPAVRPTDAGGWSALGERLRRLAERCREAGLSLLYHNHDFEFAAYGGRTALELLLDGAEPLGLELDLGWAARAGADPQALLARYQGRVARVHVKDLAVDRDTEEQGWADVGHGTIDWPPLLREARRAGAEWWIVEHDHPLQPVESLRRSAEYLGGLANPPRGQ